MSEVEIHGDYEPGFAAVREAFGRNFEQGLEAIRWGLGFGLTAKEMPLGPNPRTFFWGGWGGSIVLVDLDARLAFAYVMNKMSGTTTGDARGFGPALALFGALS